MSTCPKETYVKALRTIRLYDRLYQYMDIKKGLDRIDRERDGMEQGYSHTPPILI